VALVDELNRPVHYSAKGCFSICLDPEKEKEIMNLKKK
jgi:hypothetical protein